MIEKILTNVKWHQLKKVIPDDQNVIDQIMTKKINELVDVVNEMASYVGRLGVEFIEPKTLSDIYAEQRRWIGKLCRFRDKDYKNDQWDYGLLQAVEKEKFAHIWKTGRFKHNLGHWYDYCEPVKSTDSIIYKGGNNE